MGRQIIVTNLSRDVKRSDLRDLFSKCGKIVDVWKHDREATIVRIGFGFFGLDSLD
jgi:RNA recognition motif-containing protein